MQVHIGSLLMTFAVSKQQQWLQSQPFGQKQCTMQFADEQSVWRDAELCSFSVMRIFKKIVSFFVVLEQVSKCLVFLQNVRLGIDKLINVYQNHQTQALRLSTWNTKQCMEGSLFVINLFFFKATKNCVFQYRMEIYNGE